VTAEKQFPAVEILIGITSTVNICLLLTATFYSGRKAAEKIDSRATTGIVAVFFGLTSQVFYLLMSPWILGWRFLDRDSPFHQFHVRFPSVGLLLSVATFFMAWFSTGIRKYTSLWVAFTTGLFWMLAGLVFLFSPL